VTRLVVGVAAVAALLALTGCGSGHMTQTPATRTSGGSATTPATSTGGPGALQAEANATASGDLVADASESGGRFMIRLPGG